MLVQKWCWSSISFIFFIFSTMYFWPEYFFIIRTFMDWVHWNLALVKHRVWNKFSIHTYGLSSDPFVWNACHRSHIWMAVHLYEFSFKVLQDIYFGLWKWTVHCGPLNILIGRSFGVKMDGVNTLLSTIVLNRLLLYGRPSGLCKFSSWMFKL